MTTTACDDQFRPDYIARSYVLDRIAMEMESFPREARLGNNISKAGWIWRDDAGHAMLVSLCGESKITHDQYLQRRQELINCPPDSEAPDNAEWRCQGPTGQWHWAWGDKPKTIEIQATQFEGWAVDPMCSEPSRRGAIPNGHDWRTTLTRINRDDNTSTPEEEAEFERVKARQDAGRPHEADARLLDAQLHESVNSVNVSGTKHRISTGYLDAQLNDDIAKFREVFTMNDGEIPEGLKYDQEKPRLDLLINDMPLALEEIAAVLTYGANKYAPGNWMHVDSAEDRYLAAQMRHELSYARGNEVDGETHLHELAHSACCALFRLELALRNR